MAHEGVAGAARYVELLDDIHSSVDLPVVKPKHEMPGRKHSLRQAFAMVREKLMLDGDSLWTLATYRIEVEGYLNESWSDRLVGMKIARRNRADQTFVTTLMDRLRDQEELSGVLNSLYNLQLSILKVEVVNGE